MTHRRRAGLRALADVFEVVRDDVQTLGRRQAFGREHPKWRPAIQREVPLAGTGRAARALGGGTCRVGKGAHARVACEGAPHMVGGVTWLVVSRGWWGHMVGSRGWWGEVTRQRSHARVVCEARSHTLSTRSVHAQWSHMACTASRLTLFVG